MLDWWGSDEIIYWNSRESSKAGYKLDDIIKQMEVIAADEVTPREKRVQKRVKQGPKTRMKWSPKETVDEHGLAKPEGSAHTDITDDWFPWSASNLATYYIRFDNG